MFFDFTVGVTGRGRSRATMRAKFAPTVKASGEYALDPW